MITSEVYPVVLFFRDGTSRTEHLRSNKEDKQGAIDFALRLYPECVCAHAKDDFTQHPKRVFLLGFLVGFAAAFVTTGVLLAVVLF